MTGAPLEADDDESPRRRVTADTVALALAVGIVLVLIVLAASALVDSIDSGATSRAPSENLTQILATILGGIVGALRGVSRPCVDPWRSWPALEALEGSRSTTPAPTTPGPTDRPAVELTGRFGTAPTGSPARAVERSDRGEPIGP